jgi:hypothetical protein
MGIELMPWQDTAAKYLTAKAPGGGPLYHEVAVVVGRQNGKTTLMKPMIVRALRSGLTVMHIAQTRELPRQMFDLIATALSEEPELFPKRRGKTIWPRWGAGQEEIRLANGGAYRIAAARNGGARGWTNDLVILDEIREMESRDIIDAVLPTTTMRPNWQVIYLSNAGHEASVVLNDLRARADEDPDLAYLEWSSALDRSMDDREGWAEANPAIGHFPSVLPALEGAYRRARLTGNTAGFETEHLCRWVQTMREPLVAIEAWAACEVDELGPQRRPYMGVAYDPDGKRASAALAWRTPQGIALRMLAHVPGDPVVDVDAFGKYLQDEVRDQSPVTVGYDPLTDQQVAEFLRAPTKLTGQMFANASAQFCQLVMSGQLRWQDAAAVGDDLTWTTRKPHDESGSYQAVRADDDRPITAALAAIRAVWLASVPPTVGEARIW